MDEVIIQPYSAEWVYATFRLQLLLSHPNIQIVGLKKRLPIFASAYQNFLKVQAAVDITDMDKPSVQSIKNSLKKDLLIKTGRIAQTNQKSNKNLQKKYRIILLKIAINQILPSLKQSSLSTQDFLFHYPQYDSIYVSPRQPQLSLFSHEYLVKESQQYQWEYDVQYVYCDFNQFKVENIPCQNCKKKEANFYCIDDRQAYCWPCYEDLHRSDKKSKHKKQILSPYNCPPKCQKSMHQAENLTHYCITCKQLKCSNCLQDGQHQQGSNPDPKISIHEVIQSRQLAILFKQQQKKFIGQLKDKITTLIRQVQERIQLISRHYDLRLKDLVRQFEQKTNLARQEVLVDLNQATGLHCQLKRKYDQVLWLDNYSNELEKRCTAEMGMQIKEGVNLYITRAFSRQQFKKLDAKVQKVKYIS